jgi:hypothetical protein
MRETSARDSHPHPLPGASTVDLFRAPHRNALHVQERYRLIDGEATAEAHQKRGATYGPSFSPYGRSDVERISDQDVFQRRGPAEEWLIFSPPLAARSSFTAPEVQLRWETRQGRLRGGAGDRTRGDRPAWLELLRSGNRVHFGLTPADRAPRPAKCNNQRGMHEDESPVRASFIALLFFGHALPCANATLSVAAGPIGAASS